MSEFLVGMDPSDRASVTEIFTGILTKIPVHLRSTAYVDAYSDYGQQMPLEVKGVESLLKSKGALVGSRDPGMGILLNLSNAEDLRLLEKYGPWSIHVEILDVEGRVTIALDDGGDSIWFQFPAWDGVRELLQWLEPRVKRVTRTTL